MSLYISTTQMLPFTTTAGIVPGHSSLKSEIDAADVSFIMFEQSRPASRDVQTAVSDPTSYCNLKCAIKLWKRLISFIEQL
jgi:hypothetical protein